MSKRKAKSTEPARRRGRPLASQAHLSIERRKPWVAAGMSRRTWYRRQAEKLSGK